MPPSDFNPLLLRDGKKKEDDKKKKNEASKKKTKDFVIKTSLSLLLLVLVVLGIILPIYYVPKIVSTISSLTSPRNPYHLSADKVAIASGDELTMSWDNPSGRSGAYAVSYECAPGIKFDIALPNGGSEVLSCDNPFTLPAGSSTTTEVTLKGYSLIEPTTDARVFVDFVNGTTTEPERVGSLTITISEALMEGEVTPPSYTVATSSTPTLSAAPATSTPSTPAPRTPVQTRPTYTGAPDLSIQQIGVGTIQANGQFVTTSSVNATDHVAVRFQISNTGTNITGPWSFTASLPVTQANLRTFSSGIQRSLRPGESVQYTLNFNNVLSGSQTIVISADSGNAVRESSEANNALSLPVNVSGAVHQDPAYYPTYPQYTYPTTQHGNDLSLRIVSVGGTNGYGDVYQTQYFYRNQDVAVRFEIRNNGSLPVSDWSYKVNAGSNNKYSNSMGVLNAGESRQFTEYFTAASGQMNISLTVFAPNEQNTNNNSDYRTIWVNN